MARGPLGSQFAADGLTRLVEAKTIRRASSLELHFKVSGWRLEKLDEERMVWESEPAKPLADILVEEESQVFASERRPDFLHSRRRQEEDEDYQHRWCRF